VASCVSCMHQLAASGLHSRSTPHAGASKFCHFPLKAQSYCISQLQKGKLSLPPSR
jgi:hypothetical protein